MDTQVRRVFTRLHRPCARLRVGSSDASGRGFTVTSSWRNPESTPAGCFFLLSSATFLSELSFSSLSRLLLFLRLNSSNRRSAVPSPRTGNANVSLVSESGQGIARLGNFPGHGVGFFHKFYFFSQFCLYFSFFFFSLVDHCSMNSNSGESVFKIFYPLVPSCILLKL